MPEEIKEQIQNAITLHQRGKFDEAEKMYQEILEQYPNNASTLNLLGLLNLQKSEYGKAISYIKKAVEINPCAYFWESLGRVYLESEIYDEAIASYKKALEFNSESFDAWFNLGLSYKKNNMFEEAIAAYNSAIKIKPDDYRVYFNLGNIYENKNDTETAIKYYQEAYKLNPTNEDVNYFLAECCLKVKRFKDGWKYYEARISRNFAILTQKLQYPEKIENAPMWRGEDIKDKTLFVYYESALGDTIMYARFFPMLKEKCKKIIFKPQINFESLFDENNFGMEIIKSKTLPQDVNFDVHIPLMELPYVLNINEEKDIPLKEGYLKTNPEKVEYYKTHYFNNDKFKIGIKWQGNPAYAKERIIPLKAFSKLFELPNTQFYSVQKGEGSEELNDLPKNANIIQLGESFNDFSDTAAAIENFDLIICNDTSIAHLAGALGKKCWVLLPFVQNWRWTTDVSYSPWYKSVQPFKQISPGNWDEVFDRVYEKLYNIVV